MLQYYFTGTILSNSCNVLKKAVLYIFVFSIVLRTFYAQLHYAFYLLDSKIYTELFCENQDKPEMHCNGKCSLAKAVEETSEKQEKIPEQLTSITFADFIPTEKLDLVLSSCYLEKEKILNRYTNLYFYLFLDKEKHPPRNLMS